MRRKFERMRRWGVPLLLLIAVASSHSWARWKGEAPNAASDARGDEVLVKGGAAGAPQLFFACCDQGIGTMESELSNAEVISELKELHAGLAMAISDLSPARAQAVRRLNEAGIPVTAWIVLPGEQGYYVNAHDAPETATRVADFEKWTAEYGLRWNAVGLDIEPNFGELAALNRNGKARLAWTLLERAFDGGRISRAKSAYEKLIREMQGRGYFVETYQLLFLADERRAHSTMLERVLGIVDVRGNREVLMIYTSMNHALGAAVVYAYGPDAEAIAVGSTLGSGNPQLDAKFGPLNWEEFTRDLIVASHFSHVLGVYNLEGCIRQGFLARMNTIQWDATVTLSQTSVTKATRMRRGIQRVLWIASHLIYFAAVILLAVGWLAWWWIRKRARTSRGA